MKSNLKFIINFTLHMPQINALQSERYFLLIFFLGRFGGELQMQTWFPYKTALFCKYELSIDLGRLLRAIYQDVIISQSNKETTSCTSKVITYKFPAVSRRP